MLPVHDAKGYRNSETNLFIFSFIAFFSDIVQKTFSLQTKLAARQRYGTVL